VPRVGGRGRSRRERDDPVRPKTVILAHYELRNETKTTLTHGRSKSRQFGEILCRPLHLAVALQPSTGDILRRPRTVVAFLSGRSREQRRGDTVLEDIRGGHSTRSIGYIRRNARSAALRQDRQDLAQLARNQHNDYSVQLEKVALTAC
jgi:hypothetical protein